MPLLRSLKRFAAHALPEWAKGPLRGRLYGYWEPRARVAFTVHPLPDGMHRLEIAGLRPLVAPRGVKESFDADLVGNGACMEEFHALVREALAADGTLFDVGANYGTFSLAFCAARAGNRAVAFEPAAPPREAMCVCAEASGIAAQVQPVRAWIGASPGDIRGGIDGNGFFHPGAADSSESVPIVTVDGYAERTGTAPTLLKIDVEGGELEVLRGALHTLRAARPTVILEIHHDLLERGGVRPADVVALLTGAGYGFETPVGRPLTPAAVTNTLAAVARVVARPLPR